MCCMYTTIYDLHLRGFKIVKRIRGKGAVIVRNEIKKKVFTVQNIRVRDTLLYGLKTNP